MSEKTPRFLIVDDQRSVREHVAALLAGFGAEIVEADSGEAAIAEISAQPFDAVFLDIGMSGISGLEVCRKIRGEMGLKNLPVLVLTASESPDIVADAFAAGASDYLRKNLLQHELIPRAQAIIERRNAEIEMESARRQAEDIKRAKTDFIASMSHELRPPLNAVIGFGELLELDAEQPLSPAQREYVGHMVQAGHRLLALINDILDLAKIESRGVTIEPVPLDIGKLVHECLQLNQRKADEAGIALANAIPEDRGWQVRADATRLKQALVNLVSNAIKYNRPAGKAIVDAMPMADGQLRIVIEDTGPGIPADRLGELFQPFSRLGLEKGHVEGHGIGLALTKQLVELMGGKIGVDSRPGAGSAFWIELPWLSRFEVKDSAAGPYAADEADANLAQAVGKRILYIEDDALNQILVAKILQPFPGIELRCVETGEEGLAALHEFRPDVLLLDMQLPGIDGHEVLLSVREESAIPVIMFSADALPERISAMLSDGANDYLTKPLDLVRFKQRLAGILAA